MKIVIGVSQNEVEKSLERIKIGMVSVIHSSYI